MQHIIILVSPVLLISCKAEDAEKNTVDIVADTIAPEIKLFGKLIDTAYLNTFYINPGAYLVNEIQDISIKTAGIVNTKTVGTCYLAYDAEDVAGNNAATITRTVHVVESKAAFLNGTYDVACTCSASAAGSINSTITANNYTASVMLSQTDNKFEIVQLNIGAEYVIPVVSLSGNAISLLFYRNSSCISTGTLSPAKNAFNIETSETVDSPNINYKCKNSYTKKL